MSDILWFDSKSVNSLGFISGFFGLPGLATWAARPGPISPSPIANLATHQPRSGALRDLLQLRGSVNGID